MITLADVSPYPPPTSPWVTFWAWAIPIAIGVCLLLRVATRKAAKDYTKRMGR